MRHTLLGAVLALFLAPGIGALGDQDKPKPDDTSPADALKALQTEVRKAQQEIAAPYKDAKTDEERQSIIKKFRAVPRNYAKRALELAQTNAKDKVGYDAAAWMFQNGITGPEADKAADLVIQHHADKLATLGRMLTRSTSPAAEKLLRAAVDAGKEAQPRAQALLNLAQYFKNRSDSAQREGAAGAEKDLQAAEKLLDEIVQKHADVASVAGPAKAELFEIRHLSVGKPAPEIEAEDTDGKKFKLSDYCGKVVLLDFWGHW